MKRAFALAAMLAATPALSAEQAPVTATAGTVYQNVCHLETERSDGRARKGSAVLYRGRYLLTAGHNVMEDWTKIVRIHVNCGVTRAAEGNAAQQVLERWRASDARGFDFVHAMPKSRDFGVIRLKEPISTTVPVTLIETPVDPETDRAPVCLAGYPAREDADADPAHAGMDGRTLHAACAPVVGKSFFRHSVKYAILTFHANSGGPVLRETAGGWKLVAIHIQPSSGRLVDASFKAEVERLIAWLDAAAAAHGE